MKENSEQIIGKSGTIQLSELFLSNFMDLHSISIKSRNDILTFKRTVKEITYNKTADDIK